MSHPAWDHIVVGGGAAGCVLASRLSEDPARRVLLLEAGVDHAPGAEPETVRDTYPRSYGDPRFMWPGLQAQAAPGGPLRPFDQARVIGGGTSVMGMAALRGLPSDFEAWQRAGATGWGWNDVLPYFRLLEQDLDFGASPRHGDAGPIPVRRHPAGEWPPFCAAIGQALQARGWPALPDLNAGAGDGVGPLPMSSLPAQRMSAAMAYLGAEVRRRPNLQVLGGTHVLRLLHEGRRVTGVEATGPAGLQRLTAGETIVCAGAIHTPALLLRSGIGDAADLQALGIPCIADLTGVGRNLQNHALVNLAAWLPPDARQPAAQRPWAQNALRFSSGLPGCPAGDLFLVILNKASWHSLGACLGSLGVSVYQPCSRGRVGLHGAEPMAMPRVAFDLFSDPRDLPRLAQALSLAAELMKQARSDGVIEHAFLPTAGPLIRRLNRPLLRSAVQARAIATLLDLHPALRRRGLARAGLDAAPLAGDPALAQAWAARWAVPAGHVSGTCRMGADGDPAAVTDPQGRVHGVPGLRVADASLMPTVVSANTHLTVTLLAEKIAAAMRGTQPTRTPATSLETA